jgi:hypothetical protein
MRSNPLGHNPRLLLSTRRQATAHVILAVFGFRMTPEQ